VQPIDWTEQDDLASQPGAAAPASTSAQTAH